MSIIFFEGVGVGVDVGHSWVKTATIRQRHKKLACTNYINVAGLPPEDQDDALGEAEVLHHIAMASYTPQVATAHGSGQTAMSTTLLNKIVGKYVVPF